MCAFQNEREWRRFCCDVLDDPTVAQDPCFDGNAQRVAHRETLDAIGSATFARQSCEALADRLHQAGIASGCVGSMDDLATHPPNRFVEVETLTGPVKLLAPGALLDGQLPVYGPVPELGKHSQTICAEFSRGGAEPVETVSTGYP